jgi:hypothetical protein
MAAHENVRRRRGGALVMGPRLRGRCPFLPRGRLAPPRSPPPAGPFLSLVPQNQSVAIETSWRSSPLAKL